MGIGRFRFVEHPPTGGHFNRTLPPLHQLPVDDGQLRALFTKLQQLRGGWPVAITTTSRERFAVAAGKYQRHQQLLQDEQLVADLYVGTSPGFRKVHIRKVDDDAIYAVGLNSYEMPVKVSDWLHKTLLAPQDIEGIKGADCTQQKTEDGRRFAGIKDWADATRTGCCQDRTVNIRIESFPGAASGFGNTGG